jgi:hypothetical protein
MQKFLPRSLLLLAVSCSAALDEAPGTAPDPVTPGDRVDPGKMPNRPPPGLTPPVTGVGCKAPEAGTSPLRRLTRRQYNKAIQRLFGGKSAPADKFLEDERVEPFVSNLDASPSDGVVEQYLTTAEELAAAQAKKLADGLKCAAGAEAACGRKFIADFGKRVFRRPLTTAEVDRYAKKFDEHRAAGGSVQAGVQQVVLTLLQSPYFLYHVEEWAPPDAKTGVARFDQHSLASRMSFFLTGAPPDDALIAAADRGELGAPEQIEVQARRLIDTADGQETLLDFHRYWLEIERMPRVELDPMLYKDFTATVRTSMEADANAFISHVMKNEGGRLDALFTSSYFVDAKGVRTDVDPAQRLGVLTHPATLTSSPRSVQRGRKIREMMLCQHVPPPPPGITAELPPKKPGQSPRQRWEALMDDPTCAVCHKMMNPIGFALDNFDEMGRWRETDDMLPIDPRGEITGAGDADGAFSGPVELVQQLTKSKAFVSCATEQWLRYALGRNLEEGERCAIDGLATKFAAAKLDMRALMVAIVSSPLFVQTKPASK